MKMFVYFHILYACILLICIILGICALYVVFEVGECFGILKLRTANGHYSAVSLLVILTSL